MSTTEALQFSPLTPDNWSDLESLFGSRSAASGCWCMWWRLSRAEFNHQSVDERKAGLRDIVESGCPTGILAYRDGIPIAWVSVAPRETYPSLERSRNLRRVDDRPVWSIVCFYVAKGHRRRGLMVHLLRGAVAYAASEGATAIEAYPVDPGEQTLSGGSVGYMGLIGAFRRAGFVAIARPTPRRAVMRYYVSVDDEGNNAD